MAVEQATYPAYVLRGSLLERADEIERIDNVRYTIPEHYTIGEEHPTLSAAVASAQAKAEQSLNSLYGSEYDTSGSQWWHHRVFVESRATIHWKNGGSADVSLDRIEVFLPLDRRRII